MEYLFKKMLELTSCNKITWYHPPMYMDSKVKYGSSWVLQKDCNIELDVEIDTFLWWRYIYIDYKGYWFCSWKKGPIQELYCLLEAREKEAETMRKHNNEIDFKNRIKTIMDLGCP
jgi:hypothetical protein